MSAKLPAFDLDAFLPYRMTEAAEKLSNGLAKRYRTEFGISVAEWRVLAHLVHSQSVSVRDLEERVSLEKSKASRAASRLEADGYVLKQVNAVDRRLLELSLTEKGEQLMAEILPLAIEYQEQLKTRLAAHFTELSAAIDIIMEDPQ